MNNTELKYQWLILDENTISEADYIIWADDKIEIPLNTNKVKFYYNQGIKRNPSTSWSCWPFGSKWALSDLLWEEATEEDLMRINKLAIEKYWLVIWKWMLMSKAVDCIRNDHNSRNPNNKIYSIRCVIWDDVFVEAIKKWHSLVVWYRTSSEYFKDSQDDWIVSKNNFPKNWWHLVRTNFNDNVIKIDDNYFGTKKFNTYVNNYIKELKNNWVFFPSAYLFLYKNTMANKIRDNINLEWAKIMFDLWKWNWLNPRGNISRQENMQVEYNQKLYIDKKFEELKKYIDNKY